MLARTSIVVLAAIALIATMAVSAEAGKRRPFPSDSKWYDDSWPRDRHGRWDDPELRVPRPTYERLRNSYYYQEPVFMPGAYTGAGSRHTRWCRARFKTYRAYDNSWQPYRGPRRVCLSPYY